MSQRYYKIVPVYSDRVILVFGEHSLCQEKWEPLQRACQCGHAVITDPQIPQLHFSTLHHHHITPTSYFHCLVDHVVCSSLSIRKRKWSASLFTSIVPVLASWTLLTFSRSTLNIIFECLVSLLLNGLLQVDIVHFGRGPLPRLNARLF